jgi:Fe-S cluster assembly protein SufD
MHEGTGNNLDIKMSTQAGKETVYERDFQKDIAESGQPSWLKEFREKAFAHFGESGFPTVRDEEWKYTNVNAIVTGEWSRAGAESDPVDFSAEIFAEIEEGNRIVFVDGYYRPELGSLSGDFEAKAFVDCYSDETFRSKFGSIVDPSLNGFTALNTAFTGEGVFIRAAKSTKVEGPINIVFVGRAETANFPRVLYVGEQGSEAEVVEHYLRVGETAYFTNSVVEISLADEARLTHTRVQRESRKAFHIVASKAELGRGSVYDSTNVNLGARLSRHDLGLDFTAPGAEAWVDGLYLVDSDQHTDTHSRIDHSVPNCTSHQSYKGILDGKSRAVFNGKVFVHKMATGTDAYQSNKNLLLSNDARVDTKPQLEIFNDDVKCAHGATVGQLEDEELFYLLSRGLNEDLARNLLTYGFAEEVIEKIKVPSVKNALDEAVLNRLHARLGG